MSHNQITIEHLALVCTALAAACGGDLDAPPRTATSGPSITQVDSTVLDENDTAFVGRPAASFTVDSEGDYYIPDHYANRLLRYAPNGRLRLVYGRAGGGPGEFRSLTAGTLVLGSVVVQPTASRLKVFDRETGEYKFERWYARGVLTQAQLVRDTVFYSLFDFSGRRGILVVSREDLLRPDTSAIPVALESNRVPVPVEYSDFPGLMSFSSASFAAWDDSLLVGYAGVDYLLRYGRGSTIPDTFWVPARVRTGFVPESLAAFRSGSGASLDREARAISGLHGLWRLEDGSFLLWYQDNTAQPVGRGDWSLSGTAYLTLVSPDLQRACIDTEIDFPGTDWPRFGFSRDTLLGLDQVGLPTDSFALRTVIRKYTVSSIGCDWRTVRSAY